MTGLEKSVLICDDNIAVHESLTHFLKAEGIHVYRAMSGEEALTQFRAHGSDLLLLDVMLPGISGMEVCQQVRRSSDVPIIFLSAKSEEIDRVLGLELGADDYVTKPFSVRELTLRIRKLLYRTGERQQTSLSYEELLVDPEKVLAWVCGQRLEMTAKEIALLTYLTRNAEKVLNREQILHNVWGYSYYGDTRAVDAVIKRIRKKLPTEGVHFEIQSVYGVGYRLGRKA